MKAAGLHLSLVVAVTSLTIECAAYEIETHQDLTSYAVGYSLLQTSRKLADLGMPWSPVDPDRTLPNSSGDRRTIVELFLDGAAFEDGFGCTDDRPRNHFFNPLNGQGLTGTILGFNVSGEPSPKWAVEQNSPATPGSRGFSFRDARDHFYRGTTRPARGDRETGLGLMFQTLGHVVHHLQDMAQPQHVRNDMHLDIPCVGPPLSDILNKLAGRPSHFEIWTNSPDVRGGIVAANAAPSIAGYDVDAPAFKSSFRSAKSFWTTRSSGADDGKGMADFTNRGFVSAGSNFTSLSHGNSAAGFEQPTLDATQYENVDIIELCASAFPPCPVGLEGRMSFVGSNVEDRFLASTQPNRRASSYSFFTQDLQKRGAPNVFALNRFNFEEAYRHLIPRAVAFSAGMINYFFRGDIDLVYDEKARGYFIKNNGDEILRGAFELYYDGKDDTRYPIGQRNWGALTVGGGQRVPVAVAFPDWSSAAEPKDRDRYILVFHGDMGEEKASGGWEAVAAKVVDLSPFIVFKAAMGSEVRGVGGADFSMIVPSGYETSIRDLARSNVSGIVLTVNGQEFPAQYATAPGAAGCWGTAECARIGGSFGVDGVWEFYLYRNNQLIATNAGVVLPLVATEDFRNLYARPNATFSWICGFMHTIEASGLSITRGPLPTGSATIGLSLRDPTDGSLLRVFEFMAHDRGVPANMFMTDVGMSAMKNIRVGQGDRPASDTQWASGRLACQVDEQP